MDIRDDTSSAGTASPTNSTNSDEVELSQEQKEVSVDC